MAGVQVRFGTNAIEVVVHGEILYSARWPAEACRVADWIRYRLERGAALAELRAALKGEPAEEPGDGVLLAQARAVHGVLRGTLEELQRALGRGELDEVLSALLEAERLGENREDWLRLIAARKAARSGRAA